jgi:hypothetical protein
VKVVLLYDYLGSVKLYPYHLKLLYDANIPVVAFHPLIGRYDTTSDLVSCWLTN